MQLKLLGIILTVVTMTGSSMASVLMARQSCTLDVGCCVSVSEIINIPILGAIPLPAVDTCTITGGGTCTGIPTTSATAGITLPILGAVGITTTTTIGVRRLMSRLLPLSNFRFEGMCLGLARSSQKYRQPCIGKEKILPDMCTRSR